jgi:hypothetical protein
VSGGGTAHLTNVLLGMVMVSLTGVSAGHRRRLLEAVSEATGFNATQPYVAAADAFGTNGTATNDYGQAAEDDSIDGGSSDQCVWCARGRASESEGARTRERARGRDSRGYSRARRVWYARGHERARARERGRESKRERERVMAGLRLTSALPPLPPPACLPARVRVPRYLVFLTLECTLGVAVLCSMLYVLNYYAERFFIFKHFVNGDYGDPPRIKLWLKQLLAYQLLMLVMKVRPGAHAHTTRTRTRALALWHTHTRACTRAHTHTLAHAHLLSGSCR